MNKQDAAGLLERYTELHRLFANSDEREAYAEIVKDLQGLVNNSARFDFVFMHYVLTKEDEKNPTKIWIFKKFNQELDAFRGK